MDMNNRACQERTCIIGHDKSDMARLTYNDGDTQEKKGMSDMEIGHGKADILSQTWQHRHSKTRQDKDMSRWVQRVGARQSDHSLHTYKETDKVIDMH